MDLLALGPGPGDILGKRCHRQCLGNTHARALLAERRLYALPDYVIDGKIIAEYDFPVFVYIDHSRERRVAETEEIKEGTVLTESIGIVKIVHRRFLVAEEKKKTLAHILLEAGTSCDIGFFCEHFGIPFVIKPCFRTRVRKQGRYRIYRLSHSGP